MISAHYKYNKKDAEDFIRSHLDALPHSTGTQITVEVIGNVDECDSPKKCESHHPYSFSYPCPVHILEKIASPNREWIAAIKELRAITGWGLKESKDYVEYIDRIIKR